MGRRDSWRRGVRQSRILTAWPSIRNDDIHLGTNGLTDGRNGRARIIAALTARVETAGLRRRSGGFSEDPLDITQRRW